MKGCGLAVAAAMLMLACCMVAGCITAAEREAIVSEASKQAGEFAAEAARAKVYEAMIKQGKSIEEAKAAADAAAGVARDAASAVAGKGAGIATDRLVDAKGSVAGSWLTALIPIILGAGAALGKKALGVPV